MGDEVGEGRKSAGGNEERAHDVGFESSVNARDEGRGKAGAIRIAAQKQARGSEGREE